MTDNNPATLYSLALAACADIAASAPSELDKLPAELALDLTLVGIARILDVNMALMNYWTEEGYNAIKTLPAKLRQYEELEPGVRGICSECLYLCMDNLAELTYVKIRSRKRLPKGRLCSLVALRYWISDRVPV